MEDALYGVYMSMVKEDMYGGGYVCVDTGVVGAKILLRMMELTGICLH